MKLTEQNNKKVTMWLIAGMVAIYASLAFIAWEPNPRDWSYFARFMFVVLEAYGSYAIISMAVEYYLKTQQRDD
jgi:hypothetical protein